MKKVLFIAAFLWFSKSLFSQRTISIAGKIKLTNEVVSDFRQLFGSNFINREIEIEIWKVVYRDVQIRSTENTTQFQRRVYFQQKVTASIITKQLVTTPTENYINYSATNVPGMGEYVVLYYFKNYPENYRTFMPQSVLGRKNSRVPDIQYSANAQSKIGENKKYGVIEIHNGLLDRIPSHNATVFANISGTITYSVWDSITEFFSDAVDFVWEGGKVLAGVVVDAAGTIVTQIYGIAVHLIQEGGLPQYREITNDEYQWASEKIFLNALPDKSKIIITNLLGVGSRPFVWPLGSGHILVNLGSSGYANPKNMYIGQGPVAGQVFLHELTHVWQIHKSADIKFTITALIDQCKGEANLYQFSCGNSWTSYKIEQQATCVENCFKKRELQSSNNCEQPYVVANIRNNVPFLSPECVLLRNSIRTKETALRKRIDQLKAIYLQSQGVDVVRDENGDFWVGGQKGLGGYNVPASVIDNDQQVRQLRTQLTTLRNQWARANCDNGG